MGSDITMGTKVRLLSAGNEAVHDLDDVDRRPELVDERHVVLDARTLVFQDTIEERQSVHKELFVS